MDEIKKTTIKYNQVLDKEIMHKNKQKVYERSQEAFLESEAKKSLSFPEFIYQQIFYVKKIWWALQASLLLVLYLFLITEQAMKVTQRELGIFASLFIILIIPEFWKNRNLAESEIEAASYFSLQKAYAARMILFSIVDIVFLSSFFVVSGITQRMTIQNMIIDFLIPFFVSSCICLQSLCQKGSTSSYQAVFLCLLWTSVWSLIVLRKNVYESISYPLWGVILICVLCFFLLSVKKVIKRAKFAWEVN